MRGKLSTIHPRCEMSEPGAKKRVSEDTCLHVDLRQFLAEHGRLFVGQPRPAGFRKRRPKHCFAVAEELEDKFDLHYAEGICLSDAGPWLEHAWNMDRDGHVIDAVAPQPEQTIYLGVIVPRPVISKSIWRTHMFGLFPRVEHFRAAVSDWLAAERSETIDRTNALHLLNASLGSERTRNAPLPREAGLAYVISPTP